MERSCPLFRTLRLAADHRHVLLAQLPALDDRVTAMAFAVAGLGAVPVLLARLFPFQLAGRRHPKPLLGTLVGLHLRHGLFRPGRWPDSRARAAGLPPL